MSKKNNINQNKDPEAKFQIDRECRWFYEGTEIKRHAMVCLFARYLKRDIDGRYNIVTPYERESVGVERVPFKVTKIWAEYLDNSCDLYVETNVNDVIKIDSEDRIRYFIDEKNQGVVPYVIIRENIEAVFTRSCMLDLIDYCDYHNINDGEVFGFWSNKRFFPVDLIEY